MFPNVLGNVELKKDTAVESALFSSNMQSHFLLIFTPFAVTSPLRCSTTCQGRVNHSVHQSTNKDLHIETPWRTPRTTANGRLLWNDL